MDTILPLWACQSHMRARAEHGKRLARGRPWWMRPERCSAKARCQASNRRQTEPGSPAPPPTATSPTDVRLLLATYPELEASSLLGDAPPSDPLERLELVTQRFTRHLIAHEPELRAQLRLSLDPAGRIGRTPASPRTRDRLDPGGPRTATRTDTRARAPQPHPRDPGDTRDRGPRLAHRHRRTLTRRRNNTHARLCPHPRRIRNCRSPQRLTDSTHVEPRCALHWTDSGRSTQASPACASVLSPEASLPVRRSRSGSREGSGSIRAIHRRRRRRLASP